MSCADKVKDQSSFGEYSKEQNRVMMEECVKKCGNEMIELLPTYTKRMKEWFGKKYYLN